MNNPIQEYTLTQHLTFNIKHHILYEQDFKPSFLKLKNPIFGIKNPAP